MADLEGPLDFSRLLKKASLAGAFFVAAIWLPVAQALCPTPASLPVAQVERVVDGDTLRLKDGRSIRMVGLNTPETGRKGRSSEPFAEAAKRRLQALVTESDGAVGLRIGQQAKDHYGRVLANVYGRDGANFEAQLLSEGLGYLVAVSPNVALVDCQQAAERTARQAGLGLWRKSPVQSAAKIDRGGFALVSGEVMGVQRKGGGVWIELKGPLVLRIAPDLVGQFDINQLIGMKGKRLEARGWVVDRARRRGVKDGQVRWMMPITHPAMLDLPAL